MISQFQIGPAKTRDGRDAFVTSVNDNGITGHMVDKDTGNWIYFRRNFDGRKNQSNECHDLMPNARSPKRSILTVCTLSRYTRKAEVAE